MGIMGFFQKALQSSGNKRTFQKTLKSYGNNGIFSKSAPFSFGSPLPKRWPGKKIQKQIEISAPKKKVGISGREYHIRDQRGRFLPYGFEITELGQKKRVTIKRSSQVGIWAWEPVIRVRGTIWSAGDQTRASGTALASRLTVTTTLTVSPP